MLALTRRQLTKITINNLRVLRTKIVFKAAGVDPALFQYKFKNYTPTKEEYQQKFNYAAHTLAPQLANPIRRTALPRKHLKRINRTLRVAPRLAKHAVKPQTVVARPRLAKAHKAAGAAVICSNARLTLQQLRRPLAPATQSRQRLTNPQRAAVLRRDFFKFADGVYSSYWLGRLTNMFTRQGKKKTIIRQVHLAMLYLKFKYQAIPLLILYELLEKLKPVFLLRTYKVRRTQIVSYPYVAKNSRRYMRVLQWIRRELEQGSRRMSLYASFTERLCNKLITAHDNPRNHSLIKTRDAHNTHSNMSQFNIRYNWKRGRRW